MVVLYRKNNMGEEREGISLFCRLFPTFSLFWTFYGYWPDWVTQEYQEKKCYIRIQKREKVRASGVFLHDAVIYVAQSVELDTTSTDN